MRASLVLAVVTSTLTLSASFQVATITEANVRAAAKIAATEAAGNDSKFSKAYERELKKIDKDFKEGDVVFFGNSMITEEVSLWIMGPAGAFGDAAAQAVRRMESIDIPWPKGIGVHISPKTINSPDVERCVVVKDGQKIEPVANELKPIEQTTRMGVKFVIAEGIVWFSPDAITVNAVLTCIPRVGSNITHRFSEKDVRKLK